MSTHTFVEINTTSVEDRRDGGGKDGKVKRDGRGIVLGWVTFFARLRPRSPRSSWGSGVLGVLGVNPVSVVE